MVTQTKLLISTGYGEMSLSLATVKDWDLPLFQFSEYGRCEVMLQSEKPDAFLQLEYMNEEGCVDLRVGERLVISDYSNQEDGYVPGNFFVKWHEEGIQVKEGYFTVTPQILRTEDLVKMRDCLESRVSGISRNLYANRMVGTSENRGEDSLNLLSFINEYGHQIIQALKQVERNPIESFESQYKQSLVSKKQTAKSQRWNAVKGAKHLSHYGQQAFYEPHKVLSRDNLENRCLKHMLLGLVGKTTSLIRQDQRHTEDLKNQAEALRQDIQRLDLQQTQIAMPHTLKRQRAINDLELRVKREELESYEKRLQFHENGFKSVKVLNAQLLYLLNETWLADISSVYRGQVSSKLLTHPGYAYLYRIFQDLTSYQGDGAKAATFPYHQTSILFEYYNVLLTMELLEGQGFKWTSGWLKNYEGGRMSQINALNAGEVLWFEHESGQRVKLSYDSFIKTSNDVREATEAQLVSGSANGRRPDLLLELFEGECFLRAMIIEVKYRKLNTLYQETYETDVLKQLAAYRMLQYYDPTQTPRLQINRIHTVVAVYPAHQGSDFRQDWTHGFQFIPILPTTFDLEEPGIHRLNQTLIQFLMQ